MPAYLEISGTVLIRLVQVARLLQLIDPVRGLPTAYALDQESQSIQISREIFLIRKYLDSFALICATEKSPDSVSAACLEEATWSGPVTRVASNGGVSEKTLNGLQDILNILGRIATRDLTLRDGETDVLLKIIRLDSVKIRYYASLLKKTNTLANETIQKIESRLLNSLPESKLPQLQDFLDWFGQVFPFNNLPLDRGADFLLGIVAWARKAREFYLDFLKLAFARNDRPLPRWICVVLKLGRYAVAAVASVQIASEMPALFEAMVVESVPTPAKVPFRSDPDEMPLASVLRRVPEVKPEVAIPCLASIWETDKPEKFFTQACPVDLVTHAELQLIGFYDHNPQHKPRFRFIGVSKKSCYLCSLFLATHPSGFSVSSCHQKIYLSWIPPPSSDAKIYRLYKDYTNIMSKKMEGIARQELMNRLGPKSGFFPADSTAGVSLTGLTEWRRSDIEELGQFANGRKDTPGLIEDLGESYYTSHTRSSAPPAIFHTEQSFSHAQQAPNLQHASTSQMSPIIPDRQILASDSYSVISLMVFHFRRLDDVNRQDIVMLSSILDAHTLYPSWSKLIELLKSDDSRGMLYKESDILRFNNGIQVRDERQFHACIQYLLNSGVLNAEVTIWDGGKAS